MDKILRSCGMKIVCAENGFEALSILGSDENFDLVLMDWDMPEMDGLETVRLIRRRQARSAGRHIPIIAFTANQKRGDREKCLAAGMDAYLPKDVWMPRWRQSLVDNLQGLIAGDFELEDFKNMNLSDDRHDDLIDLHAFDHKTLDDARALLKSSFAITIEEYLEDAGAYIRDIKSGVEAGDLAQVGKGSHPLKSNSKSFGLLAVSSLAERINQLARDSQPLDMIAPLVPLLQEAFKYAEKYLHDSLQMHQR